MNEGDIVLASFPQADGQPKRRPAVVLRKIPPFGDLLICAVSSQLHQHFKGLDEFIVSTDTDFRSSGLLRNSVIRLGSLITLPRNDFDGKIGRIAPERHLRLLKRLAKFLVLTGRST